MKKHKRYRNQIKDDKRKEYDDRETSRADMTDFRRPPYAVRHLDGYSECEYSHTHNTSTAGKLIRAQAEQIREDPCVNRKHSAWIEDADQIAESKYGIRGDADDS